MRIAAIDVGTNSLHMIVCRIRPDLSFEVVDREKEMVRLGMGGLGGRRLSEESVRTAILTLSKFVRIAASHGVDEIVAAATSAVREAENGADFVEAVRQQVGLTVKVIAGTEEARLIHLAAVYAVDTGPRRAVVIDIGGGSTEITLGTAQDILLSRSFKLGVIRLTEAFAASDPLSAGDERRMTRHIRAETDAFLAQLRRRRIDRVIGTSGTILSLGSLAAGRRVNDDLRQVTVPVKALHRLRGQITRASLAERLKLADLDPRRADIAPAGAVLLDTLLTGLGAETLTLCDFALREGLVLDYIQRNAAHIRSVEQYPDIRRRSVIELAERCQYFPDHARQVSRLALQLFDALAPQHQLGPREREWLDYAALLHDIGSHIAYERHHKHSQYLIRHGGLRGFEPEEVEVIGLIARYHRKGTPRKSHEDYAGLPPDRRRAVRVLAALVRLAEGLDRSHTQVVSGLRVTVRDEVVTVRVAGAADADLELWAAGRHAAPLADLLGRPLTFTLGHARVRAAAETTHARRTRPTA